MNGLICNFLVAWVLISHVGFMVLEMYYWTRPLGLRIFRQDYETAKHSAKLAANQGLYNGFLAAGLAWALLNEDPIASKETKVFFMLCVTVAGIYGAYSVNKRIFLVQAVPAILALICLLVQ